MTYVPQQPCDENDKIGGFSPRRGHAGSDEEAQVHDTSFKESILELQASFSVFQKVSYALGAFILAVIAWSGSAIQSLQNDRTKNADHIESIQKDLINIDSFMAIRAAVPEQIQTLRQDFESFKTYEQGRKATNEQNDATERALISQLQIDVTTLKTRFDIHEHNDENQFDKRPPSTGKSP